MKRKLAALVFGNSSYPAAGALKNPKNDAEDIAKKLKGYGFETIVKIDATRIDMDRALKEFATKLNDNDVGLFFFAGHGMQIEGVNYLLAIDTDTSGELEAKHSSLSLDRVIDTMAKSTASTKIIILDACRNNPWERAWHRSIASRGLASVYAPKGTIIGFATSPGEVAGDGSGRNGTYTSALLQHIDTPDCTIETMFKRVRNTVAAETHGKQTSWEHTSLSGEFFFNMGLGKLVQDYKETSLADTLFVVDESRKSHQIVKGLKTHNWYLQNPALELLTARSVTAMSDDNLFVIGRNIYQAACGGANAACSFVANFMSETSGFDPEKRKAILDGMLFEIFFDSKAQLRDRIKGRYFGEVFDLQKHTELKDSFDFIAEALTAANGQFFVLPGKGHGLSATVAAKEDNGIFLVEEIYIDGQNVLKPSGADEDDVFGSGSSPHYWRMERSEFEELLSTELAVPARLLKIAYSPPEAGKAPTLGYVREWRLQK